ncbi:hypothetical protein [Moheibacter lacus]|uniref:Uncharacterized protein n=1 Tax=Moheibacter lacus TaxID=2745851 RepID=A0A838ZQP2_9FLAO|nr:hypothetical protein [Moheibacter lacus]MBA5628322.1 hypothetical protein [Moheibacter lacus]
MKKIMGLLLLFGFGVGFGQQTIFQNRNSYNTLYGTSSMNKEVNQPKEAKGSQYFQENFMYAFVDDLEKPFKMRYNAFFDEMEFEKDGVTYDLDKGQYNLVNFDDLKKKYVIVDYQDGNDVKRGFLIELTSGEKVSLYKREKIGFVEGKKSASGFGIDTTAEYKPLKDEFFLGTPEGAIILIPSSKNKFLQLFKEKNKEIEKFLKDNKINLSKEKDLKKVADYINTL